ncbi:MAG: hypothetical protein V3R78_14975, partial [Thermodesulfobacteriota bacterium]
MPKSFSVQVKGILFNDAWNNVILRFIVCFGNPVLCTGSQKETLALSCFLCLTAFGRKNKATRFTGG